jgi:HAD superfamily hydrolase (TIGR01509 family)
MQPPKAFLFDLNGTMINDMPYHVSAWHSIMNRLGANITLERMKQECYGKNHDVIERIFPGRFMHEEKTRMSFAKEKKYQDDFRPSLKLIEGLETLLADAHRAGIKLGIGSAAIMFNIDFVLDGLHIRKYFDVIVSADDVLNSKPDPETWLKCADKLKLFPPECIVFEDSPKGAESALNAGMQCIIITNTHEKAEFANYTNVIRFIDDYNLLGSLALISDN